MIKYGLLLLLLLWIDPNKIGKVNKAKSEAKEAFQRGEFKNAIAQYKTLVDSLGVKEDEVTMNLAHSYFQLNDTVNAKNSYASLTTSPNAKIKSLANQQLGVLANREGKFEEALNYFRNALKTDPSNEEARYNYEMVKKKLEEKKKEEEKQNKDKDKDKKKDDKKDQKDKDNKDQKDKKDQQKEDKEKQDKEKDQKNKEQQEKDKQQKEEQKKEQEQKDQKDKKENPSVSEKLKEMKMSEDKARMVLEAMKNQEVQYLQQNKRKATKPKSKGKPDW